MRILLFIPSLNSRGGVERATVSLANALSQQPDIQVSILLFENITDPFFSLNENIDIFSLNIRHYKRSYLSVIRGIFKSLLNDVDFFITVETMSLIFSFIPYVLTRKKTKLKVWEHFNFKNDNGRKARRWLRVLAAKKANLIVLLTKRDEDQWLEELNIKANITHIHNVSPFIKYENSYDITSKNIISIGRYTRVKGFDRLIEIWEIFQKKYDGSDWVLNIVGYGEEKESLEHLIEISGVTNIFLTSSNDVENDYRSASFYCMTSYFEGLPMVLIEAQSFGLPCVAFDVFTGPSEILDESTGILIKDGDLESYADAIYKLASNPELRNEMSFNAFEARRRFSEQVVAERWIDELNKLTY